MTLRRQMADPAYLRADQYKDDSKLNARAALHRRFTRAAKPWFAWVYEHIDPKPQSRLLEVGCGPGGLWLENRARLPHGGSPVLVDFSPGMVSCARAQVDHAGLPGFRFAAADAQALPFPGEFFDIVVANHMLYHVPDPARALAEFRRVLKPGGVLYAATNGAHHMQAFHDLLTTLPTPAYSFSLENGLALLAPWFDEVALHRHESRLEVTEVAPLVAYIESMQPLSGAQRAAWTAAIEAEMAQQGGVLVIEKATGLFVARRGASR